MKAVKTWIEPIILAKLLLHSPRSLKQARKLDY